MWWCKRLGLDCPKPDLTEWAQMVERAKAASDTVEIALVGKYVALHDAYLSVVEALTHGGIENDVKVKIRWVDSELVTDDNAEEMLGGVDGVIVPGGFGDRGIEGMISSIYWARDQQGAHVRHLPGYADGRCGVRPPRPGSGRRPLR